MPKLKSRRAAQKRFSFTGSGKKVKHNKAFGRHLLTKKSASRKRKFRQPGYMSNADMSLLKKMMPYK